MSTAQTYFATTLPALLAKNADKIKMARTKFAFNVTGDAGGKWLVDLSVPSVVAGEPPKAHDEDLCMVKIADADFQTLLEGKLQGMLRLKAQGKLALEGSSLLALRLQPLFALS